MNGRRKREVMEESRREKKERRTKGKEIKKEGSE